MLTLNIFGLAVTMYCFWVFLYFLLTFLSLKDLVFGEKYAQLCHCAFIRFDFYFLCHQDTVLWLY